MASFKTRGPAVGTLAWVQNEKEQVDQIVQQEKEEFSYVVRNELDWLNEHMEDIFSNSDIDLKDIMKTPGKLRGKTPRTVRKREPLISRQPLTDIFAPNTQVHQPLFSPSKALETNQSTDFVIAEDADVVPNVRNRSPGRAQSPMRIGKPGYIDSGYHGMTEDEMEVDVETRSGTTTEQSTQKSEHSDAGLQRDQDRSTRTRDDSTDVGPVSDESFISAEEDLPGRTLSGAKVPSKQTGLINVAHSADAKDESVLPSKEIEGQSPANAENGNPVGDEMNDALSTHTPSESSPEQPLARKSSFAFSSLPSRNTRTTSRSLGIRESQVNPHIEKIDAGTGDIDEPFAVSVDNKTTTGQEQENAASATEDSKAQAKTSTQLLQERITLLGKVKDVRTASDNAAANSITLFPYPKLPEGFTAAAKAQASVIDQQGESDEGLAASKPALDDSKDHGRDENQRPTRTPMHQKSYSTIQISAVDRVNHSESAHKKASSVTDLAYSIFPSAAASTTPAGSPLAKRFDGTLSASKNKFWSAVKSAKNIFASSASASAAAKLEAHDASPILTRSPQRDFAPDDRPVSAYNVPGESHNDELKRTASQNSKRPSRKSTESNKKLEKELKAQQKAAEALEKAREKERKTAARQKAEKTKQDLGTTLQNVRTATNDTAMTEQPNMAENKDIKDDEAMSLGRSIIGGGRSQASIRPVRHMKAESTSKPAPVSVRLASQTQRLGQSTSQASLSKSQHESSAAPPPPPKSHLRTNSVQSTGFGSTMQSNARVRALEAAARKKEADERAAQRKVEQKKEAERRRAAKAEEERRAEEERKAAEQQRMQEAKLAAQRKAEQLATETRRKEQLRLEQIKMQEEAQKQKAAQDLAESVKKQQLQLQLQQQQQQQQQQQNSQLAASGPSQTRNEVGGTLRQLIKTVQSDSLNRSIIHSNPAKPAKRIFQPDEEELQPSRQSQSQRPPMARGPPSYQQNEAKRRRTNEEQEGNGERHSVMAPPKRPSNMRKEGTLSKFPHGYAHATPSAVHHPVSLFKSAVNGQHQQQQHTIRPLPTHPSQTVQMSNARIPFAESVNPPVHTQMHNGYDPNKFRTPARPTPGGKSAKSSPLYTNPDNIQLPEIQTDSEDEDSEDERARAGAGARVPSWVASPALRDLLTQQQLVDPESVFGPIGELKMEEVFKNGKQDRLKRFRDRGSSAAWVESGDAVTSAEKRQDMEARERVAREGGWSFRPQI